MSSGSIVITCHSCGNQFPGPAPAGGPMVYQCPRCQHPMFMTSMPRPIALSLLDLAVLYHLSRGQSIDEAFELADAPTQGNYRLGARVRLLQPGSESQVHHEVVMALRQLFDWLG